MFNKKKSIEILADGISAINRILIKQQEFDNHQTHRANVHDGLIGKVENDLDKLRDDIRLIMEYLGVHKEVINDTFLVEDDCICDDCLANEDNWEDVKPKKKK
jgi:hypothetical protein